jgi:WD40 repeat protein
MFCGARQTAAVLAALSLIAIALPVAGQEQNDGKNAREAAARTQVFFLAVCFSCDSAHLVTVGDRVRVYDLKSADLVHETDSVRLIRTVAASPTRANLFAAGGDDGVVRFWQIGNKEPFRVLKEHLGIVQSVAFSPDGRLLASAATIVKDGKRSGGELKLWNVENGERIRDLKFDGWGTNCVTFSRDGKLIAFSKNSSDEDVSSTIEIYGVEEWRPLRSASFRPGFAMAIAFFPDSKRLLITGGVCIPQDGGCMPTGKIWVANERDAEADELDELGEVVPDWRGYYRGGDVIGTGERFFTCTEALRVITNADGAVGRSSTVVFEVRDAKHGKLIWSRDSQGGSGSSSLAVSPDGKTLACCDLTTIMVVESGTGKLTHGIGINE